MNYYKIKIELEKRGLSVKDFCRQIDVTEQGFYQMIRNESMKVDVLERISAVLNVPISYWFDAKNEPLKQTSETVETSQGFVSAKQIDAVTNELNKLLKGLNRI